MQSSYCHSATLLPTAQFISPQLLLPGQAGFAYFSTHTLIAPTSTGSALGPMVLHRSLCCTPSVQEPHRRHTGKNQKVFSRKEEDRLALLLPKRMATKDPSLKMQQVTNGACSMGPVGGGDNL